MNRGRELDTALREAEAQQKQLADKISSLKEAIEVYNNEPIECKLAEMLHAVLCKYNHADGCAWYYEKNKNQHDWTAHTHDRWYQHAVRVSNYCKSQNVDLETAMNVIAVAMEKP